GFGRDRERERIPWANTVEKAASGDAGRDFFGRRRDPVDKKYIFVYIRPFNEETEPREFVNCQDVMDAIGGPWSFAKLDFDKENSHQKAWGVKTAPMIIGCDLHGNDFVKVAGTSIDNIRTVIRNTPPLIQAYETRLKADFQKATDAVKSDEEKGAKLFVDICLTGKKGYKEVSESQAKLGEITEIAFKKGELASAVSPESGVEYHEDLVKLYRSTAPGAKAEIVLAMLDHARGNVQPAIQRLLKVMKYDVRVLKNEVDAAAKALEDISKAGDAKIEVALSGPDKALAREVLRKLAKDYQGTDAGKHAADAAK
ncbi:MAG TPA: hypothetical protein VJB14_02865, partial [Planctomycetota bacterium]|nr:hypothetical protein [Planctomycetota bacterium]